MTGADLLNMPGCISAREKAADLEAMALTEAESALAATPDSWQGVAELQM